MACLHLDIIIDCGFNHVIWLMHGEDFSVGHVIWLMHGEDFSVGLERIQQSITELWMILYKGE